MLENPVNKNTPDISLILSVYNGELFIEQSIRSVQRQTIKNWELIIINDGSTDSTDKIIKRLSFKDQRIRVITQKKNMGLTKSLNRGIKEAHGQYIARLDSGDIASKKRFEIQKKFLDSNLDHVAVGGFVQFISEERLPVYLYKPPLKHEQLNMGLINGNGGQIAHPALMVRASAITEINGYCEDFILAQDTDLLLRLAEIGKLANLNEIIVEMRLELNSLSSRKRVEQISFSQEALRRAIIRRGLPQLASMPKKLIPKSEYDLIINWVKKSIIDKNYLAARKYALKAFKIRKTFYSLKLFLYSIMGSLKIK